MTEFLAFLTKATKQAIGTLQSIGAYSADREESEPMFDQEKLREISSQLKMKETQKLVSQFRNTQKDSVATQADQLIASYAQEIKDKNLHQIQQSQQSNREQNFAQTIQDNIIQLPLTKSESLMIQGIADKVFNQQTDIVMQDMTFHGSSGDIIDMSLIQSQRQQNKGEQEDHKFDFNINWHQTGQNQEIEHQQKVYVDNSNQIINNSQNDFTIQNIAKEDVFVFQPSEIEIQDVSNNFSQDMDDYFMKLKNINLPPQNLITSLHQQNDPEIKQRQQSQILINDTLKLDDEEVPQPENLQYDKFVSQNHYQTLPVTQRFYYEENQNASSHLNQVLLPQDIQQREQTLQQNQVISASKSEEVNKNQFEFNKIIDFVERQKLFKEISEIPDPSKIILTLSRGFLNLLSLVNFGRFSDLGSWPEISNEFKVNQENLSKQMRRIEKVARQKKFSDQQFHVLNDQYLNSVEIQLALKSTKRHFAFDLITFLQLGVNYMNQIVNKKIKLLTNPIDYKTQSNQKQVKLSYTSRDEKQIQVAVEKEAYKSCQVVRIMRKKIDNQGSIDNTNSLQLPFENLNKRMEKRKSLSPFKNVDNNQFDTSKQTISTINQKGLQQSFMNNNSFYNFLNTSQNPEPIQNKENSIQFNDKNIVRNRQRSLMSGSSHSRTMTPQFKIHDNNLSVCSSNQALSRKRKQRRLSMHLQATNSLQLKEQPVQVVTQVPPTPSNIVSRQHVQRKSLGTNKFSNSQLIQKCLYKELSQPRSMIRDTSINTKAKMAQTAQREKLHQQLQCIQQSLNKQASQQKQKQQKPITTRNERLINRDSILTQSQFNTNSYQFNESSKDTIASSQQITNLHQNQTKKVQNQSRNHQNTGHLKMSSSLLQPVLLNSQIMRTKADQKSDNMYRTLASNQQNHQKKPLKSNENDQSDSLKYHSKQQQKLKTERNQPSLLQTQMVKDMQKLEQTIKIISRTTNLQLSNQVQNEQYHQHQFRTQGEGIKKSTQNFGDTIKQSSKGVAPTHMTYTLQNTEEKYKQIRRI
eukprot:403334329